MNSLSILEGCFNLGFSGKILNFRPLEAVVLGGVGLVIIYPAEKSGSSGLCNLGISTPLIF